MEYEQSIINQVVDNFDFAYMFAVNALTYFIIKVIDELNGDKVIGTWMKRLVLLIVIGLITLVYSFTGYERWTVIINSACVAPVAWSWIFKPIIKKLGGDYKQLN